MNFVDKDRTTKVYIPVHPYVSCSHVKTIHETEEKLQWMTPFCYVVATIINKELLSGNPHYLLLDFHSLKKCTLFYQLWDACRVPLNECSSSAIMALSTQNHIFMSQLYKQNASKVIDKAWIRAICYFQMVNIKQREVTVRCLKSHGNDNTKRSFTLKEKKTHQSNQLTEEPLSSSSIIYFTHYVFYRLKI